MLAYQMHAMFCDRWEVSAWSEDLPLGDPRRLRFTAENSVSAFSLYSLVCVALLETVGFLLFPPCPLPLLEIDLFFSSISVTSNLPCTLKNYIPRPSV